MTYYEELIESIENYINNKDYDSAYRLIYDELKMPYVPNDIEEKLSKYLADLKRSDYRQKAISDDDIGTYLLGDYEHQLIACSELNNKNLRDYIDICECYLKSDGFANSKALLIDSLIRQEINYEFTYVNGSLLLKFNPKNLVPIEENTEYIKCNTMLENYFIKDPSKYHLSIELLYKEALLTLPMSINCKDTTNKIIKYIEEAFSAK